MKKINLRFSVLLLMVLITGLSRMIIQIDNFTPIGAMALFGGAYFSDRWKAFLLPLVSLFLSDMLIQGVIYKGQFGFPLYESWYYVYGTFALIVLFGTWMLKKVTVKNILLAAIVSSLAHWIITDFGVWMSGCNLSVYTKDLNGFILCYTMALPYLKDFMLGTLFYSAILFGAFEWAQRKYPALAQPQFA